MVIVADGRVDRTSSEPIQSRVQHRARASIPFAEVGNSRSGLGLNRDDEALCFLCVVDSRERGPQALDRHLAEFFRGRVPFSPSKYFCLLWWDMANYGLGWR